MENNIDIKNLWAKKEVPKVDISDIVQQINKYQQKEKFNTIVANVLLGITSAFIIWVGIYFNPEFISTKIGIILCVLSMFIYIFYMNKNLKIYKKLQVTTSNKEYLNNLLELKKHQHFIQNKLMGLYFILLSTGLLLYLYEYTIRMPLTYGVLSYVLTISWIGFNWFYIRKKQIRKSNDRLNSLIEKIEPAINS